MARLVGFDPGRTDLPNGRPRRRRSRCRGLQLLIALSHSAKSSGRALRWLERRRHCRPLRKPWASTSPAQPSTAPRSPHEHRDDDHSFAAEALPAFISEAHEQIETIEHLLLQLEEQPDDRDLLDALFRCAHTVKGSAGLFGLDEVVRFTHHVETLLARLREGLLGFDAAIGTLLLQSNDQIRLLIAAGQGNNATTKTSLPARPWSRGCARASGDTGDTPADTSNSIAAPGDNATQRMSRWQIRVAFGIDTLRNGMDPLALLNYLRTSVGTISALCCEVAAVPALDQLDAESCHLAFEFLLDTVCTRQGIEAAFSFVAEDCALAIVPLETVLRAGSGSRGARRCALVPPRAEARTREPGSTGPSEENRFIRVHADRLDDVINLLGELVIASAGASMLARETHQSSLIEANQEITSLIEEIRNGTLQLRMVPIGETFARFRRVVRDTAAELGKEVALEIVGGDTELDKSVVERIADPLMHLVRNALDHGLEPADERAAAGKAPQGRLTLSACHESGGILIRIRDDGRGIQRDKVLARGRERGLVEAGAQPSDDEIFNLIFEPGFSTADKVTNLSGRGVGMDVVRRNIEALRGTVTIGSNPGLCSCIEIRLPLTLAIIDGFLVGVGHSKFIFPLDAVVEVIESRAARSRFDTRGRSCVELRGQLLPVVDLRKLYALDAPEPERHSVVVVRYGNSLYGVMVDVLLGQHQTVIKPLARMFRSLRGMAGSSILGTGEVALIFDVPSLNQLAAQTAQTPSSNSSISSRGLPDSRNATRQPLESPAS